MNYCNFAKVIIARSSKDENSVEWWKNKTESNSKESTLSTTQLQVSKFSNTISAPARYDFYQKVMHRYPKMYVSYKKFKPNLSRLQNYLTNNRYWKNSNKNGEKQQFLQKFSLQSWSLLSEREKNLHSLQDCARCEASYPTLSTLHTSISENTENIMSKAKELADEIETLTPNRTANGQLQMLNILEPIFESKFQTTLKNAASFHYKLTEKQSGVQKFKEKINETKKSNEKVSNILSNENEINSFLSSGLSYNQRDRDRKASFFETPTAARERSEKTTKMVKSGEKKAKRHTGNLQNYNFEKQAFLKHIKAIPFGSKVSWRGLAIKFNLTNKNGVRPPNAGQVLLEIAKALGVNVNKFNPLQRLSGRDYFQRVRRAKYKLYKRVSIPTPRPTKSLQNAIQRKLHTSEIYIGEKIAPKIIKRNKIMSNGKLQDVSLQVHGRKIPLEKIRYQMNTDQSNLFRNLNHKEINTENTRHLKFWHDHSDILNHSYVAFMVSTLYDPSVFLTNEEFRERFPDKTPIDVQSAVEKPYLYILGQSKSSDSDQMTYLDTRIADLAEIQTPTTHEGFFIYDKVRVFTGDGPARQFEAGQQRGGHYSCLCGIKAVEHQNLECAMRFHSPSLQERVKLFRAGCLWKGFSLVSLSPLNNLKRDDLIEELEARGVDTFYMSKPEMQEKLATILHGTQRPPALLCSDNSNSDVLSTYEIPASEPLHDLTNVVQNLITELPAHIEDKKAQQEFEKFSELTIGDKNQLKGSDARLYAIKLANFVTTQNAEGKISKDIVDMCTSLVEIISICYSLNSQRTSKRILRFHNQCFLFSFLCKRIIGIPKKMTARKFYGCHFHCLTVHTPQTYRLFCLRSLIPEQEERSFGDLRTISLRTSSRQCGKVIDNAVMRYNIQQQSETRNSSYKQQESNISHQARLLPPAENSTFPLDLLRTRPYLFQTHLEQIADYLLQGKDYWWSVKEDQIVFHDGPTCSEHPQPPVLHFRSQTLQDYKERTSVAWSKCLTEFEARRLQLPLTKIKVFEGKKSRILKNEELLVDNSNLTEESLEEECLDSDRQIKGNSALKTREENSHRTDNQIQAITDNPVEGDQDSKGCQVRDLDGGDSGDAFEVTGRDAAGQESAGMETNEVQTNPFSAAEGDKDSKACPVQDLGGVDSHDSFEVMSRDAAGQESAGMETNEVQTNPFSAAEGDKDSKACPVRDLGGVDSHDAFEVMGRDAAGQESAGMETNEVQTNPFSADSGQRDVNDPGGTENQATDSRERDDEENMDICAVEDQEAGVIDSTNPQLSDAFQKRSTKKFTSCKRKLFASKKDNSASANHGSCKKPNKSGLKGKQSKAQNTDSMSSKVHRLLPDNPIVEEYCKYRRLLKGRPNDKIIIKSYEVALAKLQTCISKVHNDLKKNNQDEELLKAAEELMIHWGIYYF